MFFRPWTTQNQNLHSIYCSHHCLLDFLIPIINQWTWRQIVFFTYPGLSAGSFPHRSFFLPDSFGPSVFFCGIYQCNLFTQDSSTQMEHLVFSKVLLLLPNFPAGLTEAQGSQVTCPGQMASVARNRLEPAILLALYPALGHAPFYKLFCARDKLCPLFLLVYRHGKTSHQTHLHCCSTFE